jgi:hypothetical protein
MLLQVLFHNGEQDRIESENLSHMIREGRIKAFKRSNGWVYIGKDRIRKFDYIGLERTTGDLARENETEQSPTADGYDGIRRCGANAAQ